MSSGFADDFGGGELVETVVHVGFRFWSVMWARYSRGCKRETPSNGPSAILTTFVSIGVRVKAYP